MNRYTLCINWKIGIVSHEKWEFVVISDASKDVVKDIIKNYQKNHNVEFESPVELMDAVCDEYGWQWEDFCYDIGIKF